MTKILQPKEILGDLFCTGLDAVNGCIAVEQQLLQTPLNGNIAVVAIGKAAAAMMLGAQKQLKDQIQSALIIIKTGHSDNSLKWPCVEAGHPIPNEKSLEAGIKLLEFIENIPKGTTFLALVSGGASALVESLPENVNLESLQKINKWLLASGLEINEMNKVRQSVSLIKAGKILNHLSINRMTQFLISDVKNDDIGVIGSGLFVSNENNHTKLKIPDWLEEYVQPPEPVTNVSVESHIVASNEKACQAIIEQAKKKGYEVTYHGQTLYGDVFKQAELLANYLCSSKHGIHIWGGEPTLVLPEKTGRGGRNQSLALALACLLENIKGITVLVGATDGNDGSTDDAGAIIDGLTLKRGEHLGLAQDYLKTADAGTFLAETGDLLSTGPTGTNVMDIVIAIKEPLFAAS